MLVYISNVEKVRLFTAVFSQLSIFTADCLHHPIQMAGVETISELHTLSVINSWYNITDWEWEWVHHRLGMGMGTTSQTGNGNGYNITDWE